MVGTEPNRITSGHVVLTLLAIAALATGHTTEAAIIFLGDIAHQLHQMRADFRGDR